MATPLPYRRFGIFTLKTHLIMCHRQSEHEFRELEARVNQPRGRQGLFLHFDAYAKSSDTK